MKIEQALALAASETPDLKVKDAGGGRIEVRRWDGGEARVITLPPEDVESTREEGITVPSLSAGAQRNAMVEMLKACREMAAAPPAPEPIQAMAMAEETATAPLEWRAPGADT